MTYQVYTGRPEVGTKSAVEERCYDYLSTLTIPFLRVEHEALYTMEALAPIEKVLNCEIAKNLFLTNRQATEFYLLLMPGNKVFKTKYLSAQLGCSRLSFGSEEQLLQHLGTARGSASVLGLLHDQDHEIHLIIDNDLADSKWFACHPCNNTATLRFLFSSLTEIILPDLNYVPLWVSLPGEIDASDSAL